MIPPTRDAYDGLLRRDRLKAVKVIQSSHPPSDSENSPPAFRGESHFVRELRHVIPRVARSRASLLIEGETGTGKSHLARLIHRHSPRSDMPFQVVDCAAIPRTIFTREMFGHTAGAFTGAERPGLGRLEAATGGTVLMHGLQDLDPGNQASLLRVYEEGEITPLGANRPRVLDLRFIHTSQVPLSQLVETGRLRPDLFYRLTGVNLRIPPLRERREDLAYYLEHYLVEESRALGRPRPTVDGRLRSLLFRYDWPGNLRELQHTVRGMLTLLEGNRLGPDDLPAAIHGALRATRSRSTETYSVPTTLPFQQQVEVFQRILVERAWGRCDRDRRKLEEQLGLAPHQLKYLLKKLGLTLEDRD